MRRAFPALKRWAGRPIPASAVPVYRAGTGRCEPRLFLARAVSTRKGPRRRPPRAAGFSVSTVGPLGVSPSGATLAAWCGGCSSPRPAGTAPASSGPSRRSSARSSCTARRSTSAGRSSTTRTSSASSSARRRLRRERGRTSRRARCSSSRPTASPRVCANARTRAGCGRSTPPARSSRGCMPRSGGTRPTATRPAVGHAGHEEVEGTLGRGAGATIVVETVADAERVAVPDPARVAYVTQTTLSVDETAEIVAVLRRRFPGDRGARRGRHLLRDDEPPAGGQGACRRGRPVLVIGSQQLVELEPSRRDGPRRRRRGAPDRGRDARSTSAGSSGVERSD